MTRVFVSRDAASIALGADAVAAALAPHATVVRTGSRGLFWLEPMIEVETAAGRVAYGPVAASDIPGLLDAGMLEWRRSSRYASATYEASRSWRGKPG